MQNFTNKVKNRWREILQSVVAVIMFLSIQNLPFRGHREDSNLNELCDQNENIDTRGQARGILGAIQRFSFVSFLQF